jgi:hypothetical protein
MDAQPIYHNNIVWKFKGSNKYPKQVYRDEHNAVFRTLDSVFAFTGYKPLDRSTEIKLSNSLETNKPIFGDIISSINKSDNYTSLSPDYSFKLDSHVDDKILNLQIFIIELDENGNYIGNENPKWKNDTFMDDSINLFGSSLVDELDIRIIRQIYKQTQENESDAELDLYMIHNNFNTSSNGSIMDKIKGLFNKFTENKVDKEPKETEIICDPYMYLEEIPLSEIIKEKVNTFIYNEMKNEDPEIRNILEPLVMVIRII